MKLLFEDDAYLKECSARVTRVNGQGVELDQTVFYATGGGQPGDSGKMVLGDGREIAIIEAKKGESFGDVVHILAEGGARPAVGDEVTVRLDWARRYTHMRFHTAMHVMCALIKGDVTGGNLSADKARLDFNLPDGPPDKGALNEALARVIAGNHPTSTKWITDEELDAKPDLVRTMSVRPPVGAGRVRLLNIEGIDLQPCGGTHLKSTGEIGAISVSKIENKGKMNRRFTLRFTDELG